MYARVTEIQSAPERADESIRYAEEKVRPAMLARGAQGLDVLTDRKSGHGYIISWWKDADAARASEAAANQVREQSRQDLGFQLIGVQTYEVTVEENVKAAQPRAARATTAQGDVARINEISQWTTSQLLPAYRAQPGFCGWCTLTDRQTGKSLIMSLWESDAAMMAAEALLSKSRGRATQEMGLRLDPTRYYELSTQPTPPTMPTQQPEIRP
jgi:heme-degrading monooxygenase HmoA